MEVSLQERVAAIVAAGVHRRHEELVEEAVERDGVARDLAELAHELSHEEGLAPAYALALVASSIGVQELEAPSIGEDDTIQQSAPEWVLSADATPDEIGRERRLRSSIRRMRHHLERESSPEAAVESLLAEPDVGHIVY